MTSLITLGRCGNLPERWRSEFHLEGTKSAAGQADIFYDDNNPPLILRRHALKIFSKLVLAQALSLGPVRALGRRNGLQTPFLKKSAPITKEHFQTQLE